MKKELSIEVVQRQQSRILGGSSLKDLVPQLSQEQEVYVVYDNKVAWAAGELSCDPVKAFIGIDTSEKLKSMETVLFIAKKLMEAGASRKALVVAVGGGITTDVVGLAASLYMRGVRYANVPTTLLAQVDAALGGKTGVNLEGYKNMLGTIVQPVFTYLCVEVLQSLPPREFRSGAAELLKTFLLEDAGAYRSTVALLAQGGMNQQDRLQGLIEHAAEIKANIVARDPFDQGERAKLNLGHTFAHAIEHEARLRGDDITHGEAVAIGMVLSAEMGDRERISNGLAPRLREDFRQAGLPTDCPYPLAVLTEAMTKDKKAVGRKVNFILLRTVGDVTMKEVTL